MWVGNGPANLVRYLVCRTKIWQFSLVVSHLYIVTNQKNHPNLVLYQARRTKDGPNLVAEYGLAESGPHYCLYFILDFSGTTLSGRTMPYWK